jgi:hypothetical protein
MLNLEIHKTDIDEIFAQGNHSHDFDTSLVLEKCKEYFDEQCKENGSLDPRPTHIDGDSKANLACRVYAHAARNFLELGRIFAAYDILLYGWDLFNVIQQEKDIKIYKGIIAIWIAKIYHEYLGDIGAATRWALLTHIDDYFVGHGTGEGTQGLLYSFGMNKKILDDLNKVIESNKPKTSMGWSQSNGYADDMLVKFILEYPQYAHIFSSPTSVIEFPPCIPYLNQLWEAVKNAKSVNKKGANLEYLVAYLFLLIPGFIPQRNLIPEHRDSEFDLVVSNMRLSGNLEAELFGRSFLVECKNWSSKVGVADVGYFLYRMKITHTKFGVLFAVNGITRGKKDLKHAENLRQRAFHEDDTICIVIDGQDIEHIISGETTFRSLLMEKTNALRFGKPRGH